MTEPPSIQQHTQPRRVAVLTEDRRGGTLRIPGKMENEYWDLLLRSWGKRENLARRTHGKKSSRQW